MRIVLVLAAVLATLAAAPPVRADDDARVRGTCTGASLARLRVRADDGRLQIEFELANRGRATQWRVVIVRERRLAWQGVVRAARRSTVRVRRSYPDWFGTDTVVVRAVSRHGEACRASATV